MNYYDYDDNMQLECGCGWKGTGKEADTIVQDQFLDIRCPRVECDWPLLKVLYPTQEETEQAFADGKNVDNADLMMGRIMKAKVAEWETEKLSDPKQLPELEGEHLDFVWDRVDTMNGWERSYIIRLGDRIVWEEEAFYEDAPRFTEVVDIFKKKYGTRFNEMAVTWLALDSLMGDRLGYWGYVKGHPILDRDGHKRWDLTT